jgi:hypothetical protein
VSFLRASRSSVSTADLRLRQSALVEERRAINAGRLCEGTLACRRCDAPVAAGAAGLSLVQPLACPFCDHRAPVRDFLSLRSPTRPARVVVRLSL